MLADIVGRRKAEVERDEAREQAAKAEERAANAEAEVEHLRRLIEGNGEGNGAKWKRGLTSHDPQLLSDMPRLH